MKQVRWYGLAAGVAAVAVAAVVMLQRGSGSTAATGSSPAVALTTATVEVRDLVAYEETAATLSYAESATVSAPVAGTVTSIVAAGTELTPGLVIATIDGQPVVGLLGEIPTWRDLSIDSEDGADVRQLETNLVALGYDPDGAIEIDETFDDATAAAVELWEADLGIDEPDGEVPQGQIAFLPGALLVVEQTATVGTTVDRGGALVGTSVTDRQFTVPAAVGTAADEVAVVVDHLAAIGSAVTTGTVLFWQAGVPVVAVEADLASFPALERDLTLGVEDGSDVKVLEQLLATAGADPDGAMVVDDHFDEATAAAVVRWWQAVGSTAADAVIDPATVVVPAGSLVGVPPGLTVGTAAVAEGAELAGDATALVLTSPARVVTTNAEVGSSTFTAGAVIDVELPDESIVSGTVTSVGSVASASDGGSPTVPVTITLDAAETADVAALTEVPVTLRTVSESTDDTLVVPVTALVALSEGGYAVEVVDDADAVPPLTRLVAVETGQFTDGFVAVTSDDLAEGDDVVVPS